MADANAQPQPQEEDGADPRIQRPNMTNMRGQLQMIPFRSDRDDPTVTAQVWSDYKDEYERKCRWFGIEDPSFQKDGLLLHGGPELRHIDKTVPQPARQEGQPELNVYQQLISKLDSVLTLKKNPVFARFQLYQMKQEKGENLNTFANRVREAIDTCDYHCQPDIQGITRDVVIFGMNDKDLQRKSLQEQWELTKILADGKIREETHFQHSKWNKDNSVNVKKVDTPKNNSVKCEKRDKCQRCGGAWHVNFNECKARKARCFHCDKVGHFSLVCKSKQNENIKSTPRKKSRRSRIKKADITDQSGSSESEERSDLEDLRDEVSSVRRDIEEIKKAIIKKIQVRQNRDIKHENNHDEKIEASQEESIAYVPKVNKINADLAACKIEGVEFNMEFDSGSPVTCLDSIQFETLQTKLGRRIKLEKCKRKLLSVDGSPLDVRGQFEALLENANQAQISGTVYILNKSIGSTPLIGREEAKKLGLYQFKARGCRPDEIKLISTEEETDTPESTRVIVEEFKDLFRGIGLMKDPQTGKPLEGSFHMVEDAKPIAQKPRKVPYHLLDPLKEKLEELENDERIEKVPSDTPIKWCSPIVTLVKPKNPNEIRMTVDLRLPNKSMQRSRIVQATTTEDFLNEFADCKVFSKLDLNSSYHQLSLDNESKEVATFSTPWGNYRFKTLPFGALTSQDEFDSKMAMIINGLQKTMNNRDDILIGGTTQEEHDENLRKCLQRMKDYNVTLRRDKCMFSKKEIEFMGNLFTEDGLKIAPDKITTIQNAQPPNSKETARSFYAMVQYVSRFIDGFSQIAKPIRDAISADQFVWEKIQQEAFEEIKKQITTQNVLKPYVKGRKTIVKTDGSIKGIAGALFQETEEGLKPVHYVGRATTDVESRYSQTEIEALAVAWVCERFSTYLLGAPEFEIECDHKPLLNIFNNPRAKLPPRVERFVMRTQNLKFTMRYVPGKSNTVDFLSRFSSPEEDQSLVNCEQEADIGDVKINADITKFSTIKAIIDENETITLEKIQRYTKKDKTLQELIQIISSDTTTQKEKLKQPQFSPYVGFLHELSVVDGMLLKGLTIVIPADLTKELIQHTHKEGHPGITKLKERLRSKYYIQNLNKLAEKEVRHCFLCQAVTPKQHVEPLKIRELPEKVWDHIQVDFIGPYPDGYHGLVFTDLLSRYPEVEFVKSQRFKILRKKLKKIFSIYGIPSRMDTDGGPPFRSEEMDSYMKKMGIYHHIGTPEHPQTQGAVERFNQVINKIATISALSKEDYKETIYQALMTYRDTPHPATGKTPYELMFQRPIKTTLEEYNTNSVPDYERIRDRDQRYKEKIKEYHDRKKHVKEHSIAIGDMLLLRNKKKGKQIPFWEAEMYCCTRVKGATITATRLMDGRTITRDSSDWKQLRREEKNEQTRNWMPDNTGSKEDWKYDEDYLLEYSNKPHTQRPQQQHHEVPDQAVQEQIQLNEAHQHNTNAAQIPQNVQRRSTRHKDTSWLREGRYRDFDTS